MNRIKLALLTALCCAVLLASALPAAAAAREDLANTNIGPSAVIWQPKVNVERMVLTLSGPHGVTRHEFARGTVPSLDIFASDGFPLPDGSYSWELRAEPVLSAQAKRAIAESRATGDMTEVDALTRQGLIPDGPLAQSGHLTVAGGTFVLPGLDEPVDARPSAASAPVSTTFGEGEIESMSAADQQILDDLIVDGSICAGLDCVNGESFGFDTLRLKENNLRIRFFDTSNSASFPTVDWQITANSSDNGGANKFSIDDIDGGRTPFTIEASAPTNSLYVDDGGRLGFGTMTPVVQMHLIDGNTPTLRLEQDGSNGFTPQTWDLAGNETNFFVRDATNGSKLPFRIRPNAATNSLYVDTDGDVGMGTNAPGASLHVRTTDGTGQLFVEDTQASGAQIMALLESSGTTTRFTVINNNDTSCTAGFDCGWSAGMRQNSSFIITREGSGTDECTLTTAGNFSCIGTVSGASSRTVKSDILPVDPRQMLARVLSLPVTEWTYTRELADGVRHVSPIAEDFHQTFGLGHDEKLLAPADVAGVALAAIQGLNEVVEEKDSEIDELRAENAELESRLAALEALVAQLAN